VFLLMTEICLHKEECEFKNKRTLACSFKGTCNQKAQPYMLEGKTIWLRKMNGDLATLFSLPKHLRKQLIKECRK